MNELISERMNVNAKGVKIEWRRWEPQDRKIGKGRVLGCIFKLLVLSHESMSP